VKALLFRLLNWILRLLAWPWAARSEMAWPRATQASGSSQMAAEVAQPPAGGAGMEPDTANSAGRRTVALLLLSTWRTDRDRMEWVILAAVAVVWVVMVVGAVA
jgi:hypothetical protein